MNSFTSFLLNIIFVIISTCLQWKFTNNPFIVLIIVYICNILVNYFVNNATITYTYKKYILLESILYTLGVCSNITFVVIGVTIPWSNILKALSPIMVSAITKWLPILEKEKDILYYDKLYNSYENLYIDIEQSEITFIDIED